MSLEKIKDKKSLNSDNIISFPKNNAALPKNPCPLEQLKDLLGANDEDIIVLMDEVSRKLHRM